MVKIIASYNGEKRTTLTHTPSGNSITTDAPKDNNGKGESFSPTDLLAASLGACMMTVMGIHADKNAIDLSGSTYEVVKHMAADPRRVSKLDVVINLPTHLNENQRHELEEIATGCPVKRSLHPDIDVQLKFNYNI